MKKLIPINDTTEWFKNHKGTLLNQPEHIKAMEDVNDTMEEAKLIYIHMNAESERSAANTIINS